MKDYRLSEIKNICEQQQESCDNCECAPLCHYTLGHGLIPTQWNDITPRDMIELPCKIKCDRDGWRAWQVIYRAELGDIQSVLFTHEDEAEANKFLQKVKNNDRSTAAYFVKLH